MIKPFLTRDISLVMQFWIATQEERYPKSVRTVLDGYETVMKHYLEDDALFCYEIEGQCVGYVALTPQMEIIGLYVQKSHRYSGIGSALVEAMTSKFTQVYVTLAEQDTGLMRFFASNSFALVHVDHGTRNQVILQYYQEERH